MPSPIDACLQRLLLDARSGATSSPTEFLTRFSALQQIERLVGSGSVPSDPDLLNGVQAVLMDRAFTRQRQVYFFYRAAAEVLRTILVRPGATHLRRRALDILRRVLYGADGPSRQAVVDILSGLPTAIKGPRLGAAPVAEGADVSWRSVLKKHGFRAAAEPVWFGRSLVVDLQPPVGTKRLVFKAATAHDSPEDLAREVSWMRYLNGLPRRVDVRFEIPAAIGPPEAPVFRLRDLPAPAAGTARLHPRRYAVAFVVHRDYFRYPNGPHHRPGTGAFKEMLLRNARLLGLLAAMGVVHQAPIPLFHNRIQARRRTDGGRYQWQRAGRLDRWLASCRYPNLGPTGIRDFEHFTGLDGTALSRHAGTHLMSLLLMAGSYFRSKEPGLQGFDDGHRPVDARHLFERTAFRDMVEGIFQCYFQGITGLGRTPVLPFGLDQLVERLIDEMGVDRHMEEVLRVADQEHLSDEQFRQLLMECGYEQRQAEQIPRGVRDLTLCSGPHLGAFNSGTSLPEMNSAVGAGVAMCMAARFETASLPAGSNL